MHKTHLKQKQTKNQNILFFLTQSNNKTTQKQVRQSQASKRLSILGQAWQP